jgi:cytochrome oxidase Cu insertion factor (SCO1/SenC/PrrC family)
VTDVPGIAPARRRGLTVREAALVLVCTIAVGTAGGVIVHELRRPAAAPAPDAVVRAARGFHGQGVWAAGVRPAPPFTLRDQHGTPVSLRSLRGRPVLLAFLDSQCRTLCPVAGRELGSIMRRLPARLRPALLVVSVDPRGDTRTGIAHALAKWRLTGPWTVHWLNAATRSQLAAVWKAYHVDVRPTPTDIVHTVALYLIDRHGDERTAYLYPFLQGFVQRDLVRLARERT